jgi:hypothetical protein
MICNTSETKESIGKYNIMELEEMVEAIATNNGTGDSEALEDANAMEFIKKGGFR